MRQEHEAGERLFADYAGQAVAIEEAATGEFCKAVIFVATLGASSYCYAEGCQARTWPAGSART